MPIDKQIYLEDHQHQKNFYHKNNFNQTFKVSQFYLALLLILLLLLGIFYEVRYIRFVD